MAWACWFPAGVCRVRPSARTWYRNRPACAHLRRLLKVGLALAVAKTSATVQEQIVASMLERFSATVSGADSQEVAPVEWGQNFVQRVQKKLNRDKDLSMFLRFFT